jgi:hypothetical protein
MPLPTQPQLSAQNAVRTLSRAAEKLNADALSLRQKVGRLGQHSAAEPLERVQSDPIAELYDAVRQIQEAIVPILRVIPDVRGERNAAADTKAATNATAASVAAAAAVLAAMNAGAAAVAAAVLAAINAAAAARAETTATGGPALAAATWPVKRVAATSFTLRRR